MDNWQLTIDNDSGMWYEVWGTDNNHCHAERSEVSVDYLQGFCYRFLTTCTYMPMIICIISLKGCHILALGIAQGIWQTYCQSPTGAVDGKRLSLMLPFQGAVCRWYSQTQGVAVGLNYTALSGRGGRGWPLRPLMVLLCALARYFWVEYLSYVRSRSSTPPRTPQRIYQRQSAQSASSVCQ